MFVSLGLRQRGESLEPVILVKLVAEVKRQPFELGGKVRIRKGGEVATIYSLPDKLGLSLDSIDNGN